METPSPRPLLSHFSSLSRSYLPHESPWLISPCHLMNGPFASQPPFLFSSLARLGVKPRLSRSSWRAFASTHLLIHSPASSKEVLFACPPSPLWNLPSFTVVSTLSSPCSILIRLFLTKVQLSLTLTFSRSGDLDKWLCSFSFWQRRLWRPCQLLTLWHRGHACLFGWPSLYKFFCRSLCLSASSLLVSITLTSLLFLFSFSPTLTLSLPLCPLPRLSLYLKLSGSSSRNCFLSLPLL